MRWPRTALSLLVGCGSAQAVQPSPPPVEVLPASAPQPEGTAGEEKPSARAITGYPPPVEPPPVACRLTGKWESDQPHALALQPSGAIFATFHAPTHAEVTLGEAPSSAFVELSSEHIRLVGFVPGDKLLLHAAQPFLVAGFAAPGAGAALRWIGASSGSVSIEVGLPGHARARIPVRDRRACDEVRLDSRAAFDPVAAIDGAAGSAATLAGGQAIVLQAEPGRRPLAELRFDKEGDAVVDVIERRQLHARIVVHPGSLNPLDQVVLVGWVQASSLRPRSGGQGGSWASGGSRGTPRPPRRRDANEVQCPHEVPLVAGLGGERRLVGALAANQRLDVVHAAGSGSEDLVEVTVRDAPVEPAAGVRFFAKRSALCGCADAAGAASSTHAR